MKSLKSKSSTDTINSMKRSITVDSTYVSSVDADDESEEYIFGVQETNDLSYSISLPKCTKFKKPNLRSKGVKNLGNHAQPIPNSIPIRFNAQSGTAKYNIRNSFQEFKIQIEESSERTPLLQHDLSSYSSKPKEKNSSCKYYLYTILVLFLFAVAFTGLDCHQLANLEISRLKMVSKTYELFEFDLHISASNNNIFPVYLESTDLDVFVGVESPNELLAHVRSFKNAPEFRSFGLSSNVTGRISIIEPDNTLGKM